MLLSVGDLFLGNRPPISLYVCLHGRACVSVSMHVLDRAESRCTSAPDASGAAIWLTKMPQTLTRYTNIEFPNERKGLCFAKRQTCATEKAGGGGGKRKRNNSWWVRSCTWCPIRLSGRIQFTSKRANVLNSLIRQHSLIHTGSRSNPCYVTVGTIFRHSLYLAGEINMRVNQTLFLFFLEVIIFEFGNSDGEVDKNNLKNTHRSSS